MKHNGKSPQRIVVKVGTSSLVASDGALDSGKMSDLVRQLVELAHDGKEVVLVSSGAIRAGMESLGLNERPKNIPDLQASAAVGQSVLMMKYQQLFSLSQTVAAQVLVTRDDFSDRKRYLNARNTLLTLLRFGCVPIVNENDTVATDEIKFGENDTLSALVAASVDADLVLNLSDVDGLFDGDPRANSGCKLIPEVAKITPEIEDLAGGTPGNCGSGGMRTKIDAAKIATSSGVRMVIANASRPNVILDVISGESIGTRFLSKPISINHRKRWIAGNRAKGQIVVNDGASNMLVKGGKSLLAVGIVGCTGAFEAGDLVIVLDEKDRVIARGLANYAAADIRQIQGKQSGEIEEILGHKDYDEVIHRDNLVLGI